MTEKILASEEAQLSVITQETESQKSPETSLPHWALRRESYSVL